MRKPWSCDFCPRGARWFVAPSMGCACAAHPDPGCFSQVCQQHKRAGTRLIVRTQADAVVYRIVARKLVHGPISPP